MRSHAAFRVWIESEVRVLPAADTATVPPFGARKEQQRPGRREMLHSRLARGPGSGSSAEESRRRRGQEQRPRVPWSLIPSLVVALGSSFLTVRHVCSLQFCVPAGIFAGFLKLKTRSCNTDILVAVCSCVSMSQRLAWLQTKHRPSRFGLSGLHRVALHFLSPVKKRG